MFEVGETDCDPEVDLEPLHPPEPEHDVALLVDHDSVADWPEVMDVGLAVNATVGAGAGRESLAAS